MVDIALPSHVKTILDRLEENGFSAYVVGGCVRDSLLCREVNDYDVCTSALPEQTKAVFSDLHTIDTGLKHGTVTVRIEHKPVEITTFRTEGDYSDGRHPDTVDFTSDIVCDLSRRDLTVNAMAYSPLRGLIDPFDGISDLKTNTVRCVGDPSKRFTEDALRIIRALRFASVLNSRIDMDTSEAILSLRSRLSLISRERIRDELFKLLVGDNMADVLLSYPSVVAEIIPEIACTIGYDQNNPHHDHTLYKHLVLTASNLPKDPILRLAGLLHDIEKPSCVSTDEKGISHFYSHAQKSSKAASEIAKRLRCSNAEISRIGSLIRYHDGVIEETEKALRRRMNQLGSPGVFDLLDLQRADNLAQKYSLPVNRLEHNDILREIAKKLIEENACFTISSLALNGKDVMSLGYRGKQIGTSLSILLEAVINGEIENEKNAQLAFLAARRPLIMSIKP